MDIITYALCRKNGGGGGGDNTHFIGTTTTALTDGATTNPITVDGESYTAVKGDIVIYDGTEFIFDGSAWQSFGGTMDTQPTKNSAKAVTSDGVYRYTAGQKEYVNNDVRGEIFNVYTGQSKNVASGRCSHAEGSETKATTQYSHAEGYKTKAQSVAAHAEGSETTASGSHSHAEGSQTRAQGAQSHAEGLDTSAEGAQSHSEGTMAHAYGAYSHVEGTMTHTYNDSTAAHAEGYGTGARGAASHSEGSSTQANGDYSHAEGYHTEANGYESHAEGYYTEANAQYSHASGNKTIANTAASTVVGKFNVADGTGTNDPKHLFIVGNGTADNVRSNILEVSDTYLNLNGIFKQNGQVIDFSTLGDDVIELPDVEYNALATKDPTKVYFVYETEEDKRTIVCMDSNGNWKYSTTIVGTTASDITGNVTAEESTVTTQPTPGFDYWYGNVVFQTITPGGNVVYHSMFYFSNDGKSGMKDTASGDGAPDAYFELGTNGSIAYHPTPTAEPRSGLYVFSSSHRDPGDTIEFNVNSKPNGFKRIYMGDELYATLNPTPIEEVSTITATTTEQSITFTEDCDYVWFRNLGDNDCYVSNHSNILIGADDVAIVKAGGGTRIAVPANKTVYIKSAQSTSVVEVHGQNSECAPFKPSGGTPNEYIKDATINSNTGSLTLTKKDGTTVVLPVSSVPAENSTTLINSDGIYRNTAGKRYYVQGSHAGGEIFNCYMGNGENVASGAYSHAEGFMTSALNGEDHAEGYGTTASGGYSHAEGQLTSVYSESGHAEGNNTHVGSAVVDPETGTTTYTGTNAKYAHAEGESSLAAANCAHAEGFNTKATGIISHAEGYSTQATGDGAHSEGYATRAAGGNSHAEGSSTLAQGLNSHAGGFHTQANTNDSTVIGRYNVADGTGVNDPKHLFIIGNGTDTGARSNILEVSDSYMNLNGTLKINNTAIGSLAMKSSASGTAVTTVGTLPSLTYDSTTESFTFSAGTLPTTGTVTVS